MKRVCDKIYNCNFSNDSEYGGCIPRPQKPGTPGDAFPKTENEVIMLTFPADMTVSQKQAFEKRYRQAAASYFPMRVAYYHQFTGGTYSRITIRGQHTRWGSCSSRGTLSFNWRLMMAPPKVLDYVVVHECHLKHMDHSRNFWNAVAEVMPDYKEQKKWLKEHGMELFVLDT